MTADVFDPRRCELGEGPLWHPTRDRLFWFDILAGKLLWRDGEVDHDVTFDHMVSAAAWVDRDTLLIASETRLFTWSIATRAETTLCPLEADRPDTRSNDGRADPMGGFWIGTMGKAAERHAGAIYRYHRGTLRKLVANVTIPNAICFAPDGRLAYFADTAEGVVFRQPLDAAGWPEGTAQVFLDLRAEGLAPDGAATDAAGNLWNAQWGAGRVACYSPQGHFLRAAEVPALHSSCPAFGGADYRTLFVTSALEHLDDAARAEPAQGQTFALPVDSPGRPEPQVIP